MKKEIKAILVALLLVALPSGKVLNTDEIVRIKPNGHGGYRVVFKSGGFLQTNRTTITEEDYQHLLNVLRSGD